MTALSQNSKKGYNVKSYGTGSVVTLPGRAPSQPNVYQFGTPYEDMLHDLTKKDPQLYLYAHTMNKIKFGLEAHTVVMIFIIAVSQ